MINPQSSQPPLFGQVNLRALGTTQTTAVQLLPGGNVFSTVAAGGTAILPGPNQAETAVYNQGANDLLVYPNFGDMIAPEAVNVAVTVPAGDCMIFASFDTPLRNPPRVWYEQNQTGSGGGGVPSGPAGGDLGGTFPDPTVLSIANVTTGTLSVAHGGTGLGAVGAPGGVLAYSSAGTIISSSILAANRIVVGGGAGLAPATLGALGTSIQVLHGNASGAPSFSGVTLTSDVLGRLPFANLATVDATSLLGNGTGAGASASSVAIGTGLSLSVGGTLSATGGGGGVTSVVVDASPFLTAGTITSTGTIAAATLAATSLLGNKGTAVAVPGAIAIGTGLTLATNGTLSSTGGGTTTIVAGAGLSGGTITAAGTIDANFRATDTITKIGSGLSVTSGTLEANASGGSVTSVIAAAGPFLTNATITTAGTLTGSASTLTNHGVLIGQATAAPVATAVMTNGQLLIGATGADPAPQTMSGDATITTGGVITVTKAGGVTIPTVANKGVALNSGTVSINNQITLTGTAGGTVTIAAGTGTTDILLNMPAAGGTVTVAAAPTFARQRYELDIVQGATAGVVVLNSGFIFGASGGPTSYTVTPTANLIDRLMLISPDGTKLAVMAVNQGFTL